MSPGDRVTLLHTDDEHTRLDRGAEGTVTSVDDLGTVHVNWDDGSSLGLVPGHDRWQTINAKTRRAAEVHGEDLLRVRQYLPANYQAAQDEDGTIVISGYDDAGWTLDGYVIPRLASGLIGAREIQT